MSNKQLEWQATLAEICTVPEHGAMQNDTSKIPFPFIGQVFNDVFLVKLPSADAAYFLIDTMCETLRNLFCEVGTHEMDKCLFDECDIIVLPGLYALKLEYYSDGNIDWESGFSDPQMGLNVLDVKKI